MTFVYYIFRLFALLIRIVPFRLIYMLSDFFYFLLYYVFRYRRSTVKTNLKNSFPKKTERELLQIEKDFYHHLCDVFFESVKMIYMPEKQIRKHCRFANREILDVYFQQGKSVIGISAHYGNWEWGLLSLSLHAPHRTLGIYKPLSAVRFEKIMRGVRGKFGMVLVPMKTTLKAILEHKNELSLTTFIADQTPLLDETVYWTNFMNQDTAVFTGPEKIARKMDFPMILFTIKKRKRGYYEVVISPINDSPKETSGTMLTEKYIRMMEQQINEEPEYWLWSHRRWKHKRVLTPASAQEQ